MRILLDYLQLSEGKVLASVIVLVAAIDISVRLWPAMPQQVNVASVGGKVSFDRQEPSEMFSAWVAERQAIKDDAEAAKRAAEAAREQAARPVETKPEVFVDQQSGQLQQFRIGNLKYRLWGVFKFFDQSDQSETAFAVLRPDQGESRVVSAGEVLGDYEVTSVVDRLVSFKATDGRVVELQLFERKQ